VTSSGVERSRRRGSRIGLGVAGLLCFLFTVGSWGLGPGVHLALAKPVWSDEAKIQVKVHDHVFHTAQANAGGCVVSVRLHFDAPSSAYGDPAPERNHYRFSAMVRFSDGQSVVSDRAIDNREAGARVIAFKQDTTEKGCWAERKHTLRKVDVHACRGAGCVPMPFE
jgi:hypothetical protein